MDKYEQIEKLAELLEKGYITKEEFEREKRNILGNNEDNDGHEKKKINIIENNDFKKEIKHLTKKDILLKCDFEPKSWRKNLLLAGITLGIYRFFFIYKRRIFLSYVKNCDKEYKPYIFMFLYIVSNILTIGYASIFWNFALSIRYILFFDYFKILSDIDIIFIIILFLVMSIIVALTDNVGILHSLIIFILAFIFYFNVFFTYRIDYLIKNYFTEDGKIIDSNGNVVKKLNLYKCL